MARELDAACTLWAHLALVYKHVEEKELDYQAVSTLLCALVFLGNNHSFDVDAALGAKGAKRSRLVGMAKFPSRPAAEDQCWDATLRFRAPRTPGAWTVHALVVNAGAVGLDVSATTEVEVVPLPEEAGGDESGDESDGASGGEESDSDGEPPAVRLPTKAPGQY